MAPHGVPPVVLQEMAERSREFCEFSSNVEPNRTFDLRNHQNHSKEIERKTNGLYGKNQSTDRFILRAKGWRNLRDTRNMQTENSQYYTGLEYTLRLMIRSRRDTQDITTHRGNGTRATPLLRVLVDEIVKGLLSVGAGYGPCAPQRPLLFRVVG